MSEKKQKLLDGQAINTLIGAAYLDSACRSLDEANRKLEAEDPELYRKLEEHARLRRERLEEASLKKTTPASVN